MKKIIIAQKDCTCHVCGRKIDRGDICFMVRNTVNRTFKFAHMDCNIMDDVGEKAEIKEIRRELTATLLNDKILQ